MPVAGGRGCWRRRGKFSLAKPADFCQPAALIKIMFTGTYTAIVTPFKNGQLDETALARLIKAQVHGGVDGIVPVGTTGESPTVDYDEHIRIIELSVKLAAGKIKVLAGTGANSTTEAIYLTKAAEKVGADGSLQVAPYYNKPSQEGLFQHFKAIARETKLPIVLYSIPGRCGIEIAVDTVTSNVIPREVAAMVNAFATGNVKKAAQLHAKFYPVFKDLFIETNPVPVKAALAMRGEMAEEYRLPLVPLAAANRAKLKATLKACGILK